MKKCLCCDNEIEKINHYVCSDCYKKIKELKQSFILLKENELKNEYKRWLRNKNFARDPKYKDEYQLKVICIAEIFKDKYNDSSKINKVIDYSNTIESEDKIKENIKISESNAEDEFDNFVKDKDVDLKNIKTYKKSDDGHRVISLGELTVDNWLNRNNIRHYYDKEIDMNTDWRYDFYLPDYDIFIEYWGLNDEKYLARRKEKEDYYKKYKNNRLIGIEFKDLTDFDKYFAKKLRALSPDIFKK